MRRLLLFFMMLSLALEGEGRRHAFSRFTHYVHFTITALIFVSIINNCVGDEPIYKLGTASIQGNYYPLGISIQDILSKENINIEVISTKGSVDNIQRMKDGEIDLAIVQNDIAFFAEHGLFPFNEKINIMRGVISFYLEPVLFITSHKNINSLSQIINMNVNVGQIESGLYIDTKIILNSIGMWELINKRNISPGDIFHSLNNNSIDVASTNTLPDSIKNEISHDKLFLLSVNQSNISTLTKSFPYFTQYDKQVVGKEVSTVAVKAILIANRNLPKNSIYEITKCLYSNYSQLTFPDKTNNEISTSAIQSLSLKKWHLGAQKYYNQIGIIRSQTALKFIGIIFLSILVIIIFTFSLNLLLFVFNKKIQFLISGKSGLLLIFKKINLIIFKFKYLFIIFTIITLFITNLLAVQTIEHDWALKHNMVSQFSNRTFSDNILWMFVFGGSGYNDNIFPESPYGKALVTLFPFIGIGGILTILGVITSEKIKNRILETKGMRTRMIKNHIIICGFNENIPNLINSLINDQITNKRNVLLLSPLGESLPLHKYNIEHKLVSYINGTATKRRDLYRANLKDADIVVIVPDENCTDPDANNILKVLTVEKYCKELEMEGIRKNRKNIYTIAEINNKDNIQLLRDAGVDEIISLGEIKTKIFAHSILNPGVSNFVNEIFTFTDYNELYSILINKSCLLNNKTYDDILLELRKYNILLLSVNIDGPLLNEVNTINKKNILKRTVITNPITDAEKTYRVKPCDILIVLAANGKVIETSKRKLNF